MVKTRKISLPHICFVGPMLGQYPGWVPNPAEHLAARLEKRGLICTLTSRKFNRYLRLVDILSTIYRLHRELTVISIQVYSGPSFVVEDAASLLGSILGIPIVMYLHGGALPDFLIRFPKWTKRVFSRATHIVAPSGFLAAAVEQHGFQASIIPNAIELSDYPFRSRTVAAPKMLWMRTFHEIYNPLMAIKVLKIIQLKYPGCSLTMGGQEKGLLSATQQLAKDLGVMGQVRFPGFLNKIGKQHEFSSHDIFLNTNHVDNMPISLVEAAACGLPIVSTRVGGIPYLLSHEETGLLSVDDNPMEMAENVSRILRDPGLSEKLSRNAHLLAEQHDWSKVLDKWQVLFQSLGRA